MRHIDMGTWPRREHFALYSGFDHPHFGMCADVDVTAFFPAVGERGYSITVAVVYVISRAANAVPEFRYRIRGEEVVEHEVVHPSMTVLTDEDVFGFCTLEYVEDFSEFAPSAAQGIAYAREHPTLEDEPGRDDLLFMTAIPWVSFTSFMHPLHLQPPDSVPRFAWGRFFEEGHSLKMPLAVQGHHALMDGVHAGKFYQHVEELLLHPELVLGQA
jgi:chloramphenicol O-acetyltransferase type A